MQVFKAQDMQRKAALLQEAALREPVVITYHDRPRFVLMSMAEFDALRGRARSAHSAADLPIEVVDELTRMIDEADAAEGERRSDAVSA